MSLRALFSEAIQLFLLTISLIVLSSCSHMRKGDGPPDYDVDVSRIPNAVPKPEPLAKYGNYKSYVVFGKRYYTLNGSQDYEEVGTASWYGKQFHAQKTSSGERYDMLAMTAAHKTLPLPTYVEVTNLANNRKVIVKVNDRGPFASNRIIDLSYVAAKKLGMLGRGTSQVRVRALNPYSYNQREPFFVDARPVTQTPRSAPLEKSWSGFHPVIKQTKPVYLQVGAFRNRTYAVKLQNRVQKLAKANVSITDPAHKQGLYKVKIGPLRDIASVTRITNQLKTIGMIPSRI